MAEEREPHKMFVRRIITIHEFTDDTLDVAEYFLAPRVEGERLTAVGREEASECLTKILDRKEPPE